MKRSVALILVLALIATLFTGCVGTTAAEVAGIVITETTKPADGTDLSASVTIAIGGFQALIAKAMA